MGGVWGALPVGIQLACGVSASSSWAVSKNLDSEMRGEAPPPTPAHRARAQRPEGRVQAWVIQ